MKGLLRSQEDQVIIDNHECRRVCQADDQAVELPGDCLKVKIVVPLLKGIDDIGRRLMEMVSSLNLWQPQVSTYVTLSQNEQVIIDERYTATFMQRPRGAHNVMEYIRSHILISGDESTLNNVTFEDGILEQANEQYYRIHTFSSLVQVPKTENGLVSIKVYINGLTLCSVESRKVYSKLLKSILYTTLKLEKDKVQKSKEVQYDGLTIRLNPPFHQELTVGVHLSMKKVLNLDLAHLFSLNTPQEFPVIITSMMAKNIKDCLFPLLQSANMLPQDQRLRLKHQAYSELIPQTIANYFLRVGGLQEDDKEDFISKLQESIQQM
ncbi:hypothetical protein FGO68_gene1894 [Halteria grandinella]|uniref:Uncharacterized protein n=1 Tax=Halteria grandinella TaxID=5974 RepID=A0A8J8NDE0_HALGN|nr:hypothetical protein FGO68_gene1894 [Halteria grandinella]